MVAKSFQSMTQIEEPFSENGKMYVMVKNEKTGTIRKVRWYDAAEYAKIYKEPVPEVTSTQRFTTQKKALGFEKGYITIFKGDTYTNLEYFQQSNARYCRWWGWYIVSTEEVPNDLPEGIEAKPLSWEAVGDADGALKSDDEIKRAVESVIYDKSNSQFVGSVGERLTLNLTVIAARQQQGAYGLSTVHHMVDAAGNRYIWNTSAKTWEVGDNYNLKGTVKDHKTIKNVDTTILARCSVIK